GVFFFQAEDGIRDFHVTGVQTCALPISPSNIFFRDRFARVRNDLAERFAAEQSAGRLRDDVEPADMAALFVAASDGLQIQWLLEPSVELERTLETFSVLLAPRSGRASCRR